MLVRKSGQSSQLGHVHSIRQNVTTPTQIQPQHNLKISQLRFDTKMGLHIHQNHHSPTQIQFPSQGTLDQYLIFPKQQQRQ